MNLMKIKIKILYVNIKREEDIIKVAVIILFSLNGCMTICQTPNNIYNGNPYNKSRKLFACILNNMVAVTGAKKNVSGKRIQ